jgi:hypothetical protein
VDVAKTPYKLSHYVAMIRNNARMGSKGMLKFQQVDLEITILLWRKVEMDLKNLEDTFSKGTMTRSCQFLLVSAHLMNRLSSINHFIHSSIIICKNSNSYWQCVKCKILAGVRIGCNSRDICNSVNIQDEGSKFYLLIVLILLQIILKICDLSLVLVDVAKTPYKLSHHVAMIRNNARTASDRILKSQCVYHNTLIMLWVKREMNLKSFRGTIYGKSQVVKCKTLALGDLRHNGHDICNSAKTQDLNSKLLFKLILIILIVSFSHHTKIDHTKL